MKFCQNLSGFLLHIYGIQGMQQAKNICDNERAGRPKIHVLGKTKL